MIFILFLVIKFLWDKEISNILFHIGDWVSGLFAENFEEHILIWNLSYELDLVAILLGISLIILTNISKKENKENKEIIAVILAFGLSVIPFFSAISVAKDLKDYHLKKNLSIFYKHCKFDRFITKYRGKTKIFYVKCFSQKKIEVKSPIFANVICDLPDGYSCDEKSLHGKNIILFSSLHSDKVYGIKILNKQSY